MKNSSYSGGENLSSIVSGSDLRDDANRSRSSSFTTARTLTSNNSIENSL